jgi:hypothetical protein
MHNACTFPVMVKHAQRKHKASKRRAGVRVNNRFKVEAYFETEKQVFSIDRCVQKLGLRSRSEFVTTATLKECARHEVEAKDGEQLV